MPVSCAAGPDISQATPANSSPHPAAGPIPHRTAGSPPFAAGVERLAQDRRGDVFPFSSQNALSPSSSGATSLNFGSFSSRSTTPPPAAARSNISPARQDRADRPIHRQRATIRSTSHTRSISPTTNFKSAGDSRSAAIACAAPQCAPDPAAVCAAMPQQRPPSPSAVRSIAESSVPRCRRCARCDRSPGSATTTDRSSNDRPRSAGEAAAGAPATIAASPPGKRAPPPPPIRPDRPRESETRDRRDPPLLFTCSRAWCGVNCHPGRGVIALIPSASIAFGNSAAARSRARAPGFQRAEPRDLIQNLTLRRAGGDAIAGG